MTDPRSGIRFSPAAPLAAALILTAAAGICLGVGVYDEIPQDALTEVLKKQQQIAFVGERTQTSISGSRRRKDTLYRQRVLHIPPSEYRVDFLDLPDDRQWHVLAQGDNLYRWGEGDTVFVSERSEVQTLGLVITHTYLDLLRANYRIEAQRGPKVAERSTYAVVIKPLHPGRPSLKAWVDSTYGVPLKLEHYDSRGKLIRRYEYRWIRFGQRLRVETFPLPEGAFMLRQERGTECASPEELFQLTGRRAPTVERLPAGFTLTKVKHGSRRDGEYLQSFYSDGYASFSVFTMENPRKAPEGSEKPGLRGVRSGRHGDYLYATGWIGETQITVMGDIAESELLEVLSSVRLPGPSGESS